jgi:hypothetical protein
VSTPVMMATGIAGACNLPAYNYSLLCLFAWVRFIFCKDEFIMQRGIWMSEICHAHNCRAVQKKKRTLFASLSDDFSHGMRNEV